MDEETVLEQESAAPDARLWAPSGGDLYPSSFEDFVGQSDVERLLKVEVESARIQGRPLAHIVFYGPPGVGKTALAHVLAGEMGMALYESSGAEYPTQKEMVEAVRNMGALWERTGRPVLWLIDEIDGMARIASYVIHPLMCPVVGTRILTSDLRWVKAEDLRVGDELLGIDEAIQGYSRRKFKKSIVTATGRSKDVCVRIVTDRGTLSVNEKHPVLVAGKSHGGRKRLRRQRWVQAKDLKPMDKVLFIGSPWRPDATYDGGWLAAMTEGEGHLSNKSGHPGSVSLVVVSQVEGEAKVAERAKVALQAKGFSPLHYREHRSTNPRLRRKQDLDQIKLANLTQILRYLGMVRPERLLLRWSEILEEGGPGLPRKEGWAVVQSLEPLGQQPVVNLSTSTHTYIAEGFVSHNTHGYAVWEGRRFGGSPVSFVGTTNRMSSVPGPLKSRFQESIFVGFYSEHELAEVARKTAARMGLEIDDDAAGWVGANAAGEPRKVNRRIMRNVSNIVARRLWSRRADLRTVREALSLSGLRHRGLSQPQYDYLEFLSGVPKMTAGIASLAAVLGQDSKDVQFDVEPYLLRAGYAVVTRSGRQLTERGIQYLGEAKSSARRNEE